MDDVLTEALRTVDDDARQELLRRGSRMAMEDFAIIPLHYEVSPWAMKATIDYTPRADQYTLPYRVRPAQ
jgi:peptide/nickel transport system substrate-binding protein